jgi:hypothetical protein
MRAGDLQLLQETMTIGAARHIERRVTLLQTRETERQRDREKETKRKIRLASKIVTSFRLKRSAPASNSAEIIPTCSQSEALCRGVFPH